MMLPPTIFIPLAEPSENADINSALLMARVNAQTSPEPHRKVAFDIGWRLALLVIGIALTVLEKLGHPGPGDHIPPLIYNLVFLAALFCGMGRHKETACRINGIWITVLPGFIAVIVIQWILPIIPADAYRMMLFGGKLLLLGLLSYASIRLLFDLQSTVVARQILRFYKGLSRADRAAFRERIGRDAV